MVTSGALAEQLRSGLQNRVDGCNSRTCLQNCLVVEAFLFGGLCYMQKDKIHIPAHISSISAKANQALAFVTCDGFAYND